MFGRDASGQERSADSACYECFVPPALVRLMRPYAFRYVMIERDRLLASEFQPTGYTPE